MGKMDTALELYLGTSLAKLVELKIKYIPEPKPSRAIPGQQLCKSCKPHKQKNPYILDEAEEEEEEEENNNNNDGGGGPSVRPPKVTRLLGPSTKDRLAVTFDHMATQFEQNLATSSRGRQFHIEDRMYLLHIQRTATEYVAAHLWKQNFPITMSAWTPSQLYVVADSPKTISQTLPLSLYLAMKDYTHAKDEEREAVKHL
ncbi:hypothetical protein BDR03DRAFT_1019500 [Suillus americanus]|nr:hypothetical protein BDR03DRAFT_1019500 [Suillus americanus]